MNGVNNHEADSEGKVINDCVHGYIQLHPLLLTIIDTPQFQRLRYVLQVGVCHLIYSGATHTRFSHSLGVSYLAGKLLKYLCANQPELCVTQTDILCVEIAGLCHDLGHGPFSHVWEHFLYKLKGVTWKHEEMSCVMLKHLISENNLQTEFESWGLYESHLEMIYNLIHRKPSYQPEKPFLFEIVANCRNGIDVDKWDYFMRDCYYLGFKANFDHGRLMEFCRVIDDEICFRDKEVETIYEMFETRMKLRRRAYAHRVVKIFEAMYIDALILAEPHLEIRGPDRSYHLSELHDNPAMWTRTTDFIFQEIQNSFEPALQPARDLLNRIVTRQPYTTIGLTYTTEQLTEESESELRSSFLEFLPKDSGVCADDIRLGVTLLNYGFGTYNPIERVRFYCKGDRYNAKLIPRKNLSTLLPHSVHEVVVRLFSTKNDEQTSKVITAAFKQWCQERNFTPPKLGNWHSDLTPIKDCMSSGANNISGRELQY